MRRHWARTRAGSTSTAFEDATCGFRRRCSLPERRCGCIGPQGMVSADLLGRDEVLHALPLDENRQRSRGHRANANSPAIGRSASAACADVAISVTPWLFSVAAVANRRRRHQRTECHPGNGIDADAGELRVRPRRGLSRMHRTVETAGDAYATRDGPLCQRHRAGLGHAAWRNLLALARLRLSETARELIATEGMTFQPGIQRLDWQSLSLRGCCKIHQVQGARTGG